MPGAASARRVPRRAKADQDPHPGRRGRRTLDEQRRTMLAGHHRRIHLDTKSGTCRGNTASRHIRYQYLTRSSFACPVPLRPHLIEIGAATPLTGGAGSSGPIGRVASLGAATCWSRPWTGEESYPVGAIGVGVAEQGGFPATEGVRGGGYGMGTLIPTIRPPPRSGSAARTSRRW